MPVPFFRFRHILSSQAVTNTLFPKYKTEN